MKTKISGVILLALAFAQQTQASCFVDGTYSCRQNQSGGGACAVGPFWTWSYYETGGTVNRARGLQEGEGIGTDSSTTYDTTCDYVRHGVDCFGLTHSDPHTGDPVEGTYTTGSYCSE